MAGKTIQQLSEVSSLTAGDQLVVWKTDSGATYKAPLSVLLAFFEENFADPGYEVQTFAPTASGQTLTVTASSSSIWVQVSPASAYAAMTIALPAATDLIDGQRIFVSINQGVTALTLTSSGATFAGAPAGLLTGGGSFTLRYSESTTTLVCEGIASPRGIRNRTNGVEVDGTDQGVTLSAGSAAVLMSTTNQVLMSTPLLTFVSACDLIQVGQTVASLPAVTGLSGSRRFVTDSNSTTFGANVVGGGGNRVPVWCDGTNWRIG